MNHLGSSRRLAELTAVSTRLVTTLKLQSLVMPENPVINDILKETRKQNTVAVNQTLQLLFNNEYLGLIAYVQCIVPLIYMAYIMVILEMPNRQFYLNESDLEHREGLAQRFTVIAAFVVLQMAILIGLHVFVATRFGVSTLYQVAFVLETHARLVQGKIATWLLFAVGFLLEHYGTGNLSKIVVIYLFCFYSSRCRLFVSVRVDTRTRTSMLIGHGKITSSRKWHNACRPTTTIQGRLHSVGQFLQYGDGICSVWFTARDRKSVV